MEKHLFERSKRNALTTGVASCYPFTSYELSDENGILFGLNKYNNSPVIIDIFDPRSIKRQYCRMRHQRRRKDLPDPADTSRMRRKGIQVFMLAPLKATSSTVPASTQAASLSASPRLQKAASTCWRYVR